MNANLILLTLCQGLFFTNNVTFIAINGLVGLSMAPLGWMATLPVTGYVVGAALSAMLVGLPKVSTLSPARSSAVRVGCGRKLEASTRSGARAITSSAQRW